jgi:hypothetical protein
MALSYGSPATTDVSYSPPRLGLIRIESFDHFLADAYEQMRPVPVEDTRAQ